MKRKGKEGGEEGTIYHEVYRLVRDYGPKTIEYMVRMSAEELYDRGYADDGLLEYLRYKNGR